MQYSVFLKHVVIGGRLYRPAMPVDCILGRRYLAEVRMKNFVFGLAAAGSLIFGASSALSSSGVAELSAVQGKVLVNQGTGFEAVTGVVVLYAGDTVMLGEDGSAQISYLISNCKFTASSNSLIAISEVAPCKASEVVGSAEPIFVQPPASNGDGSVAVLFGGALIIGGGVGAYFLLTKDKSDDNPVSAP